jgi:hypothetical protein
LARERIDERIIIECRLGSSTRMYTFLGAWYGDMHGVWEGVVEVRECHLVFGASLLPDGDLVDMVNFVPIFIERFHISITK